MQLDSGAALGAVQGPHNITLAQCQPLASEARISLVLLFYNLSHGFCQSSWRQVAVGGAEQPSCSPWECGRSAIYLARVELSSICLCIRHLHPRAVGATEASCLIPRNHISNQPPQGSSSVCRSAQL